MFKAQIEILAGLLAMAVTNWQQTREQTEGLFVLSYLGRLLEYSTKERIEAGAQNLVEHTLMFVDTHPEIRACTDLIVIEALPMAAEAVISGEVDASAWAEALITATSTRRWMAPETQGALDNAVRSCAQLLNAYPAAMRDANKVILAKFASGELPEPAGILASAATAGCIRN